MSAAERPTPHAIPCTVCLPTGAVRAAVFPALPDSTGVAAAGPPSMAVARNSLASKRMKNTRRIRQLLVNLTQRPAASGG